MTVRITAFVRHGNVKRLLDALREWSGAHFREILAARTAYDARSSLDAPASADAQLALIFRKQA